MAHEDASPQRVDPQPRTDEPQLGLGGGALVAGRWCTPAGLVFLVLVTALLAAGRSRMMRDPGTLWHTVVGERILQTGRFIETDPFSFTQGGEPWIAQQWLGEIAMALIHRIAGLDGLLLAAAALLAGLFTFLAARLRAANLPWLVVMLLLLIVIAASSYHFIPRPHLVTIALMAWLAALLTDVEAGRTPANRLLLLPPVFVVWSNVHGGALGGISSTFFVLMIWLLRPGSPKMLRRDGVAHRAAAKSPNRQTLDIRLSGRQGQVTKSPNHAVLIAVALSLSFASVLVNPYGPALPRTWLSLMNSDLLPRIIIEHAPLKLLSSEGLMILLLGGIYAVMFIRTARHGIRAAWLLPLVWFLLALTRVRHGPLFAVTAAVGIADMLKMANSEWGKASGDSRSNDHLGFAPAFAIRNSQFAIPLRSGAIPVLLIATALALQVARIRVPVFGAGWARLDPGYWPVEATAAFESRLDESAEAARVFNDMRFGGYLIYAAPQARVYIDDRCELYRDAGLARYMQLRSDPRLIEGAAACDGFSLALVETRSALARYLRESPHWVELHRDATASLYRRAPGLAAR